MSIVRSPRPESHFVTFANEVVRDNRLSYKARGILLELLSRPDNWRVDAKKLADNGIDGRTAILSGLEELRTLGYLVTYKRQKENGHFETMSVVYDTPQSLPKSGFPTSDHPTSDNPTSKEEPIKKNLKENTATPKGVQQLVTLYFDSFIGEMKPSGGQIAGQIRICLKQLSEERLAEIIPLVAMDGKPVTVNTVAFYANRKVEAPKPTYTPPQIVIEENPNAIPMPDYVKQAMRGLVSGFQMEA